MTGFTWPVRGPITSGYGSRTLNGLPDFHTGIDIGVPNGTPIGASAAGTIRYEGLWGLGGNTITIDHGNGYQTRYEHLSRFTAPSGSHVAQGQQIGLSGGALGELGAGNSTGPHLHFEVLLNGKTIDPMTVLGGSVVMQPAQPKLGRADAGNATQAGLDQAAKNPPGFLGTGLGNPVNLLPGGAAIGKISGFLTTTSNWKRIGLGTLGVALLIFVASRLAPANMPIPVPV